MEHNSLTQALTTLSDHIINTHTKQAKPLICPGTTSIPVYRNLKNTNFGYVGIQGKFNTPPLKPTKTEPSFRSSTHPVKTLFPTHLRARELCQQTYSLLLPYNGARLHIFLLAWNRAKHTSPKIQLSTVPLPENYVMPTILQDGSLSFKHTHKHSSPLQQALHTQVSNHHISATNFFYFIFFESTTSHYKELHTTSKETQPHCWLQLLPWEPH